MIIVVSDAFSDTFTGGAELTTDALLDGGFYNYKKIHSADLNLSTIDAFKDEQWVFGNFFYLSNQIILEIVKKIKNYSVVEYDYKYCKHRLKKKHELAEGECDCHSKTRGKLVALFFAKSKNLFFMSEGQKKEHESIFPFLAKKESIVLSSSFSKDTIKFINSLDTKNKNEKYIILDSKFWIKGTEDAVNYAIENKLKYELVSGLKHKELLKKLAQSKGLIFLPSGLDTCPRITIEAKLLDCDLILNDYIQHKSEPWFKNKKSILERIETSRNLFYEKCLAKKLVTKKAAEKTKFHFIVPCYNVDRWLARCLDSVRRQDYQNYAVTVVDDVSTDKTYDVFDRGFAKDNRFKIIKNTSKKYALKNIQTAIKKTKSKSDEVIIVLDGDDWLASPDVLSLLNEIYVEEECLLTYGSYLYYPYGMKGVEPSKYPKRIVENNDYRNDEWRASHLRTFKRKLWDGINKKDLLDESGEYYKMAYDQAMMLPMLEMAAERVHYIPEILHVYNRDNPLNVDKIKQDEQFATMHHIRNRERYERTNFED